MNETNERPSLYDFAGGDAAMRRLAEAHYRRCTTDPILVEAFGSEPRPEHADHFAAWVSEVFGGPSTYTDKHGGHHGLLAHHAGRHITEPQRARFVEAFMESVDEAGLPDDAEFRGRLRSYVEWGAGIAMSISRLPEAPPTDQPVPRWGWE